MRILHLSDIHINHAGAPNRHGVDTTGSLRGMLADVRGLMGLGAVVASGDLADSGAPEEYAVVRDLVGTFARERGIPVFCTTGNHDERGAFAKALGSGHLDPAGGDRADSRLTSAEGELAASSTVDGHRIVTLDSLVPGKVYGYLGAAQLDWLRELLRTPTPHGTTVVLHHPPVTLDNALQRALGLANPADLADAVRGSDVRLILCGHFHLQIMGYLESVPVWVTPGVFNRIDLTGPAGTERAVRGASATLVDLGSPHGPLFHTLHARDPRAGETVYEIDAARITDVVAREGYK
ncbi:metallophosphoesterase [Streptomyces sp. SID12488]|uniref:metallophosphoesterase family protein n=1 Tax=Streptomyces sp. SID12488 TaxID=2706040 RepID=UPI0013D9FBBA|nr:metallophosphoesterase [Streptomyces sp. SID12488]NEA61962.1 metallophosphoesterase [Streptomyces sp. SID12488]